MIPKHGHMASFAEFLADEMIPETVQRGLGPPNQKENWQFVITQHISKSTGMLGHFHQASLGTRRRLGMLPQ